MEFFLILLLGGPFVALGCFLIYRAFKPTPPSPAPDAALPVARVVVGEHSGIRDPLHSKRRVAGQVVKATVGTVSIGLGAGIGLVIHEFFNMGPLMSTKGRLLRLRGRAHLPELAEGNGWNDATAPHVDALGAEDRAVLAAAWLASARMEHASIPAFAQLSIHLAALGAPSDLVERCHRAALDELRHARRCYAMASAFAGTSLTAGPIPELARGARTPVDLVRLAVGSLVDGCVAEGIAADVASRGARAAKDPVVRETLDMIAKDEATHAELAWSVLEWACASDETAAHAVAARAHRLGQELAPRLPEVPGFTPARLADHGLCDQRTLGDLATRRIAAVRSRALALVGARDAA